MVAGGDGDLGLWNLLDLHQVLFQHLDRYLLILGLGLEQDNRTDVVRIILGGLGQCGAGIDGAVHRVLPGVMLGQHDRQLDHFLQLQFLRRHAVQDVGIEAGSGGEFDDGAWVDARLHVAGQAGDGVVRLVHDHQGAMGVHQVGEGELHPAAVQPFQSRCRGGEAGEMRLHVLVMGIDLAALGVGNAQRLNGADDDAKLVADVVRAQLGEVGNVENTDAAAKSFVQGAAIGVAGILQRLHRLAADDVGRHQPQYQRIVLLDPGIAGNTDGMGSQDRLAAAGGQAQADIGRVRQFGQRRIGAAITAQALGLFRLRGDRLIGVLRPADARFLQEAAKDKDCVGLILLQVHGVVLRRGL